MGRFETQLSSANRSSGLSVDGVTKLYGAVCALDNVSLNVETGEFMTLLGPSGSGKTTLLSVIAGFADPTSGQITIGDRVMNGVAPERRNIGVVFQGYALFPHMTVAENIAYPLKIRKLPRETIAKKVKSAIGLVRLSGLEHRYPKALSGGQQQRVSLARSLIFDPALLLLDEPLSALDRALRDEMKYEIKSIHERLGTTFIQVTHDQDEALSMSDRIAVMRDGRLVRCGRPTELFDDPQTEFVATFLGATNILRGVANGVRDGYLHVKCADQEIRHWIGAAKPPTGAISLALRPDRIKISEKPQSGLSNQIFGDVVQSSYHGSAFHMIVHTKNFGTLHAHVPTLGSVEPIRTGRIVLSWGERDSYLVNSDMQK